MAKLDHARPFAVVCGYDPDIKHRFEQDGRKFDHAGKEIAATRSQPMQAAPPVPANDNEPPKKIERPGARKQPEEMALAKVTLTALQDRYREVTLQITGSEQNPRTQTKRELQAAIKRLLQVSNGA
jgi:hypothetical protein